MNKDGLTRIARVLGTKSPKHESTWLKAYCPFPWNHDGGADRHPSFGMKIVDDGASYYNCFSCGCSGDMMGLALRIADHYKEYPKERGKPNIVALMELCATELEVLADICMGDIPDFEVPALTPTVDWDYPEWWLQRYPSALTILPARKYLMGERGLSEATVLDLDIRWCGYQHRVCFPFRNAQGLICGMHGRTVLEEEKVRYFQYAYESQYNMHLWYGEQWMDLDTPLVVTESVFDAAAIYPLYPNVVAAFSCSFSEEKALRLASASEIITIFDAGLGGDKARKKMKKFLGTTVVEQIVPKTDAGDMSFEEVREALWVV